MSNPYEQFRQEIMGGLPIDNAVSFDQFQDARLSGLVNSLQPNPQLMNNMSNVSQQINQEQINKNAKEQKRKERRQALEDIAARFGIINAQQSGNYQQANVMQNNLLQRQQARVAEEERMNQLQKFNSIVKGTEFENIGNAIGDENAQKLYSQFLLNKLTAKPKERRIVKGGDGLNYYADTGERVLPEVIGKDNKPDRKYEKTADGFYRYVDDGSKVFGDVEMLKKGFEITTTDVLGAQKDERKTFEATNKGVKNFQQLLDAAKAADGAASYALMIKFIKQLDDSVVREGEVNTFGGFQGALTNLRNQISKTTGEGFTPEVKANMINLAAQTANRLVNDYAIYRAGKQISYDAIGFDPNMIFAGLDFNLGGLDLTREYTPNDFEFIEFE